MAVSLIKDRLVKREEMEVLQEAAKAIRAHEEAQKAVKAAEAHVRELDRTAIKRDPKTGRYMKKGK